MTRTNSALPTIGGDTPLPHHATLGVVCAHPDDETFGLGAVIAEMVDTGTRVELLCLTRGERSTLGAGADLAARRIDELHAAAEVLGITRVVVGEHPDGALPQVPRDRLAEEVCTTLGDVEALLTFDHGGITGHPDHQHATDAAVTAARRLGIPVLGWALPESVAATLHDEFDTPFVGRSLDELDHRIVVDRTRQRAAMACHASQHSPVPHRRIRLQGPYEHLRALYRPVSPPTRAPRRPTGGARMNVLIIVNGPPYGSELPFNALRLARELATRDGVAVRVFLMGDAVGTAVTGQQLPEGPYHLDRMVRSLTGRGAEVGCCGSCLDARAIEDKQLVEGAVRSSMEQLGDWTLEADRVIAF